MVRIIKYWKSRSFVSQRQVNTCLFFQLIVLLFVITSCNSDPYRSHFLGEQDIITIGQYLDENQEEYSKSYRLLIEGKMHSPFYGYNPHGEGYTLFLPTNEAIDKFIQESSEYASFEEMLQDTSFIYPLVRYHTLKSRVHTDEFPDGALWDSTFTGDRLAISFHPDGDTPLIKINNKVPIVKSNIELSNGYIHVISDVLHWVEISGYDWLQQQENYSILAEAMIRSGIKKRLWWNKYTILAEHDSIYHKNEIYNVEDLINRIKSPGSSISNKSNAFHKFVGYHIIGGEYYLNDFSWGSRKYWNLATSSPLTIDVGLQIRINPGIDNFGYKIAESGDTTFIDYILPVWKDCNIKTGTGPVHSITDLLFYEPFPE